MTDLEFLKRLCEGYVRCYRTLNLRTDAKWEDLTGRELDFFARLGESLGFAARYEVERKDLTWHDVDSGAVVLYMERESNAGKALRETLPRLCRPNPGAPGCYLVAVLGWVRPADLASIRQVLVAQRAGRALALLAWVGPNADAARQIEAWVFSGAGHARREAVGVIDADRYWFAHFVGPWETSQNGNE